MTPHEDTPPCLLPFPPEPKASRQQLRDDAERALGLYQVERELGVCLADVVPLRSTGVSTYMSPEQEAVVHLEVVLAGVRSARELLKSETLRRDLDGIACEIAVAIADLRSGEVA